MTQAPSSPLMAHDDDPPTLAATCSDDDGTTTTTKTTTDVLSSSSSEQQLQQQQQLQQLQQQQLSVVRRLQGWLIRILARYGRFLSSSANQDKTLKLVQYSLWVVSQFYASHHNNDDSKTKNKTSQALATLADELSLARYVTRLLEFPLAVHGLLERYYNNSNSNSSSTTLSTSSTWSWPQFFNDVVAWSMLVYYPAEHAAYIQWKTPSWGHAPRAAEICSAWSCRAWLTSLVVEVVRDCQHVLQLRRQLLLVQQQKHANEANDDDDDDDDNKENCCHHLQRQLSRTQLQLLRNALYALPALHYSLPNWDRQPWLSSRLLNTLFWLESVVCMYQVSTTTTT